MGARERLAESAPDKDELSLPPLATVGGHGAEAAKLEASQCVKPDRHKCGLRQLQAATRPFSPASGHSPPLALNTLRSWAPGWSSSEEDALASGTSQPGPRRLLKHSTPEGAAVSWRSGLLGDVPSPQEAGAAGASPLPAPSSQELPSPRAGLSPTAPLRKRRLSTIRASEVSSGQLGSDADPWAFEEDPPVPASFTPRRRRRPPQQQQDASPQARRGPPHLGLPGIPDKTSRRRRDLKKLAAALERVRQWEIRLLQSIEEATQHELTVQEE
ncbi:coiled-coil domain-containing protein 201 [Phacochoerus africanus]|uniref:coiled-coil domain-containing protein 201 n=1 Tax=Phacochoerus africanus TaxID=41426 RepID=UPI001FD9DBD6|nr:coiled-coil domain-containing protein 201 [Phacochoerus africanus]